MKAKSWAVQNKKDFFPVFSFRLAFIYLCLVEIVVSTGPAAASLSLFIII